MSLKGRARVINGKGSLKGEDKLFVSSPTARRPYTQVVPTGDATGVGVRVMMAALALALAT